MSGKRIVLTADRSLMTNYRGNFLYGFIACGPYEVLPEWVFDKVFCPAVETDPTTGEAKVAQVGLRRIESALLQGYDKKDVFIANPEHLVKSIGPDTKVVGINVMDPLGMAPVTTTMSPEKLSYVAMKFKRMCADIIQLKKKYNFHVAVGGNGAWELAKSDRMKIHGIDTVVVGEADELALDLFEDMEKGNAPELMNCFVKNIQDIPVIEGPTVNSLIEAMRGCGRGCDFCDVNKRSKKDLSVDRLKYEAKINLDYGFDSIWLHSDEMLLYGCDNRDFIPNSDAITDLWSNLKNLGANFVGTTHMTFSGVAADPDLIHKISVINQQEKDNRWLATNLGRNSFAFNGKKTPGGQDKTVLYRMLVNSKTREVGIIRAIGAKRSDVMMIFLIQGMLIGAIGAGIGTAAGLGYTVYAKETNMTFAGSIPLEVSYNWIKIIQTAVLAFVLAIIASLYPSFRATKLLPVEAMRNV